MLVSSCDAYADCWDPFFALFAKFWQSPRPVIYLNTETRQFEDPRLDIRCPRVELGPQETSVERPSSSLSGAYPA